MPMTRIMSFLQSNPLLTLLWKMSKKMMSSQRKSGREVMKTLNMYHRNLDGYEFSDLFLFTTNYDRSQSSEGTAKARNRVPRLKPPRRTYSKLRLTRLMLNPLIWRTVENYGRLNWEIIYRKQMNDRVRLHNIFGRVFWYVFIAPC